MLKDKSIYEFVSEISNDRSFGSGMVAALVGSLGAALSSAVKKFSEDREFYKNYEVELKNEMENSGKRLSEISAELLDCMDMDRESLEKLTKAYKLPERNADESVNRAFEIQNAYKKCLETPLRCANLSLEAMFVMEVFSLYGHPDTHSDVGAAVLLSYSTVEISILNIKANLNAIKDDEYFEIMNEKIAEILNIAKETKDIIMNTVYDKMLS